MTNEITIKNHCNSYEMRFELDKNGGTFRSYRGGPMSFLFQITTAQAREMATQILAMADEIEGEKA